MANVLVLRRISLMLVAALLVNLVGPAGVQAGGGHGDRCKDGQSERPLPEGAIA